MRPNVLVVMLDDAGYSNASSFGGVMKTPTFDRIGDEGIRYTHMSVAAVCSPTRGSLLTGYNIHQIGTGIISEFATGYPGYNSQIDYTTPCHCEDFDRKWICHSRIRQMAQYAHGRGLTCRPV
jgi:arylsulfatase A-like enzyme